MVKYKRQSHVVWQCNYHIVFCPEYRFRVLTGIVKELVDHNIRMLCEWKGCEIEELSIQADHIHIVVSIPPKVSVSELMGTIKGKLAIKIFKSEVLPFFRLKITFVKVYFLPCLMVQNYTFRNRRLVRTNQK